MLLRRKSLLLRPLDWNVDGVKMRKVQLVFFCRFSNSFFSKLIGLICSVNVCIEMIFWVFKKDYLYVRSIFCGPHWWKILQCDCVSCWSFQRIMLRTFPSKFKSTPAVKVLFKYNKNLAKIGSFEKQFLKCFLEPWFFQILRSFHFFIIITSGFQVSG